jgi:hypothetical protein
MPYLAGLTLFNTEKEKTGAAKLDGRSVTGHCRSTLSPATPPGGEEELQRGKELRRGRDKSSLPLLFLFFAALRLCGRLFFLP